MIQGAAFIRQCICCIAAITLGGLCTILQTGGIAITYVTGKAVIQGAAFIRQCICYITTVAHSGLGAILHTGGIAIADVIGKAVSQSSYFLLGNVHVITAVTFGAGGETGFGTSCRYRRDFYHIVTQCTASVRQCICCLATVALGSFCAVLSTGGVAIADVLGKAVTQSCTSIGLGVGCIAAITLGSFCAVLSTGGVAIADVIGKAVSQSSYFLLGNAHVITAVTLGAGGQTGLGTGGSNCGRKHHIMSQSCQCFGFLKLFTTDTTGAGVSFFGTGGSNRLHFTAEIVPQGSNIFCLYCHTAIRAGGGGIAPRCAGGCSNHSIPTGLVSGGRYGLPVFLTVNTGVFHIARFRAGSCHRHRRDQGIIVGVVVMDGGICQIQISIAK